jgi:hypothetical protein
MPSGIRKEPRTMYRTHVLLSTVTADLGLIEAGVAKLRAQQLADEAGVVVFLRDPVSDAVIARVRPGPR